MIRVLFIFFVIFFLLSQVAVGAKNGLVAAHVIDPKTRGHYVDRTLNETSFVDFIQKMVRQKFIDYLWIDNEGAEYGIYEQFINGGAIDKADIIACQINTEFHHPVSKYWESSENIRVLLLALVQNSDYLPIYAAQVGAPWLHQRTFWINTANRKCLQKYIINF